MLSINSRMKEYLRENKTTGNVQLKIKKGAEIFESDRHCCMKTVPLTQSIEILKKRPSMHQL